MKNKKIISLMLAVCAVLTVSAVSVSAASADQNATEALGTEWTYELKNDPTPLPFLLLLNCPKMERRSKSQRKMLQILTVSASRSRLPEQTRSEIRWYSQAKTQTAEAHLCGIPLPQKAANLLKPMRQAEQFALTKNLHPLLKTEHQHSRLLLSLFLLLLKA